MNFELFAVGGVALFHLFDQVRFPRSSGERGDQVFVCANVVDDLSRLDHARPADDAWHTETAFPVLRLLALKWRTAELLHELARRFPSQAEGLTQHRPLLRLAIAGEMDPLREALDAETRAEQAKDRAYWAPLKAE